MATTSAQRVTTITYTGAVAGVETIAAASNLASPAQVQILTLAIGDNVITAPGGGTTPVACTIVKPAANAIALKLKGVGGDTGVRLHNTDPDTISIDPATTTFIINSAAQVVGVRLFWT
jgi:hypothetical protein